MKPCIMEIDNLHYAYGDGTVALMGINMVFRKGETVAIIGGNGAGKSTLFLNMNGILKPKVGTIRVKGQPVRYTKASLKDLKRQVGIVFQDPDHQLFSASVIQDVAFGPINLKLPEAEVKARVEKAMTRAGIDTLGERPTHRLSYGQKKRVALAGVLAMEPELIILDEPTAGLDPQGIGELMEQLVTLQRQTGLAVVIATHDIDLVPLHADYVYVMDKGRVTLEGKPEVIFNEASTLRQAHLRLPRIAHLMEILKEKDGLQFSGVVSTISAARKLILALVNPNEPSPVSVVSKRFGKEVMK